MLVPLIAAATLLALGASPSPGWSIPLMRGRLETESVSIRSLGLNPTDFIFRLDYLSEKMGELSPASTASERADLEQQAALELKLDAELLVNLCPVFGGINGLDESFYNEDPATPPDPVAFYVPQADKDGRYGLVFLLHGRAQTETDLLSRGIFRRLADRYHAILVAPWGTGSELWGVPATAELLRIEREMLRTYPIDRKHVYLGGVALGGSAVFRIAAEHAANFNAILSIGGGLLPEDAFLATHSLRTRTIYLIGGGETAQVLATTCTPVSTYTGFAQLEQAWGDMFDGTVRNGNTRECGPMF